MGALSIAEPLTPSTCDEPRAQSTLKVLWGIYVGWPVANPTINRFGLVRQKGLRRYCQRLQGYGEAKGFTTSACSASVSIAKDVQWW